MLDELYDMNKDYFDELSIYIEAAKHKQYVLQQDEIPKLREQAKSTEIKWMCKLLLIWNNLLIV